MGDKLPRVEQAVILCGGLGTRLGALTQATPKPLLPIMGRPFLSLLIEEIARQGVPRFLLLASFEAEQIRRFAEALPADLQRRIDVEVSIEPELAGTGGALRHANPALDELFFLFNGDSWFDIPLVELRAAMAGASERLGAIALRRLASPGRYGVVDLDNDRVRAFRPSGAGEGPALVNAGVYLLSKSMVADIPTRSSLEADVLPDFAASGRLGGVAGSHYFIDIGVPDDYARAQREIRAHRTRPALFLDRDGVINVDSHYVGAIDRFEWIEGAREAIRAANALGYYVFVVTNQAGIAKGHYTLDDYRGLTRHIRSELADFGAHIDDERYCPDHPEAVLPEYRRSSDWRKPGAGMILDLMDRWPIDASASLMIGDKASDIEAARAAGIPGHLFTGGRLDAFAGPLLTRDGRAHAKAPSRADD